MEAKEKVASVISIDPTELNIGWRARKDLGDIDNLAESIKSVGQLHPVVVRKTKSGYSLIAGMRRTEACKKLGVHVKATVVRAGGELNALTMQLAENMERKDFDKLEVGDGLMRYKKVYEKQHPETAHGATGKGRKKADVDRFTQVAAKNLGVAERTVYDMLAVSQLPEEKKAGIKKAKTSAQRNKAAADAIREVRHERKVKKLQDTAKKAKPRKKGPPIVLIQGDNKEHSSAINDGSIDVILTDPPYSLDRSTITHSERSSINEDVDWDQLDVGWVMNFAGKLRRGGHLLAFCQLEAIGEYAYALKEAGLTYHGALIWRKTNPPPAHRPVYVSAAEAMVWATKGSKYYFKPHKNAGSQDAHNVITGPICQGQERLKHPAQKPEWLVKKLLTRIAQRGDVVLDPFVGVGTTLVVCKRMGLEGVGIELSKAYVRLAKLRLKAFVQEAEQDG